MKFLVFNVAVVLALGFLFIGKPADIRHASDKVSEVVNDIKNRITGEYGVKQRTREKSVTAASVKQKPLKIQTDDLMQSLQKDRPEVSSLTTETARRVASNTSSVNKEASSEKKKPHTVKAKQNLKPKNGTTSLKRDKSNLHRERKARKNNAEIREILAKKTSPPSKPVTSDGNGFMSPSDRRRELMALADDMELAHAQSLGNQ